MKYRQISFADQPYTLSDEWLGIAIATPELIAAELRCEAERSFDELDYFSFFGLEANGHRFGFTKHRGGRPNVSVITAGNNLKTTFEDVRIICDELLRRKFELISKADSEFRNWDAT